MHKKGTLHIGKPIIIVLNHLEHPDIIMVTEVDRMNPPMAFRTAKFPGVVFFFLLGCASVFPQHLISAKAGNVQFIHGEVYLNGTSIRLQDGRHIQMEDDQVLATGKGYAELLLAPDTYLRLGENASFRMMQTSLTDTQLELSRGPGLIEILEKLETDAIRMHISNSIVEIKKAGLYRFDADTSKLWVYGGDVRVIQGKKKAQVKKGRMVTLDDGKLQPEKFDVEAVDLFHRWAAQRSYALYTKNLFFTKPVNPGQLAWRPRPEGIYNPNYRVALAANEDWNRYWQGLLRLRIRQLMKRTRIMIADPQALPVNNPDLPTQ